ncbi:MAG: class I SAM-dependent methyltransferase, partial [Actinomycetes bacterium]
MPGAAQLRQRSYDLLRLPRRATVVDVGCGTGRAVAELTEVAEPGAHAIGVDPDPAMLAAARSRFPDIDVRDADAAHLPLGEGEAHRYRADKVYHVLPTRTLRWPKPAGSSHPVGASCCSART